MKYNEALRPSLSPFLRLLEMNQRLYIESARNENDALLNDNRCSKWSIAASIFPVDAGVLLYSATKIGVCLSKKM